MKGMHIEGHNNLNFFTSYDTESDESGTLLDLHHESHPCKSHDLPNFPFDLEHESYP